MDLLKAPDPRRAPDDPYGRLALLRHRASERFPSIGLGSTQHTFLGGRMGTIEGIRNTLYRVIAPSYQTIPFNGTTYRVYRA